MKTIIPEILAEAEPKKGETCRLLFNTMPPSGVAYITHKFALLDAIERASIRLERNLAVEHEDLVVGQEARVWLTTLPQFINAEKEGHTYAEQDGLFVLGQIVGRHLLLNPKMDPCEIAVLNRTTKKSVVIEMAAFGPVAPG